MRRKSSINRLVEIRVRSKARIEGDSIDWREEDIVDLLAIVDAVIGVYGKGDLYRAIDEARYNANHCRLSPLRGPRARALQNALEELA